MVAKSPTNKERRRRVALAAINPNLVRETIEKVDQCMARLQELQYTVSGGRKTVSGVSLSPRSTRGYLRTSLRCKQETLRIKGTPARKSPPGKLQCSAQGDWKQMSLPAMLIGETVTEILQASQFAKELVAGAAARHADPMTPNPMNRTRRQSMDSTPQRAPRAKEKQRMRKMIRLESMGSSPGVTRARARIRFKSNSPVGNAASQPSVSATRISPRNRPWAKKAVLFPNPAFLPSSSKAANVTVSPTKQWNSNQKFYKTRSPIIGRVGQQQKSTPTKLPEKLKSPKSRQQKNHVCHTPHKFLIKSPPSSLGAQLRYQKAIPAPAPAIIVSSPECKPSTSKKMRRCSFSPARLATRLVSPLKTRLSLHRSRDGPVTRLKQRPGLRSS